MHLESAAKLVLLLIAIKNPIQNLTQKTVQLLFPNMLKRKALRDEIDKTLNEVTRNLPTEFNSMEYVGVAKEIASPAPSPTNGRIYTGDTLSFIVPFKTEEPMCFMFGEKKKVLVWKKSNKWYYCDSTGVVTVLHKKQALAASSLVDKAQCLVSQDFDTHHSLYFRRKQVRKDLNLEKLHRSKKRSRLLDPELVS